MLGGVVGRGTDFRFYDGNGRELMGRGRNEGCSFFSLFLLACLLSLACFEDACLCFHVVHVQDSVRVLRKAEVE